MMLLPGSGAGGSANGLSAADAYGSAWSAMSIKWPTPMRVPKGKLERHRLSVAECELWIVLINDEDCSDLVPSRELNAAPSRPSGHSPKKAPGFPGAFHARHISRRGG